MWWWLILLVIVILIGWGLWRGAARAKDMEDDTGYLFEGGSRGPYGAKFFRILGGHRDD